MSHLPSPGSIFHKFISRSLGLASESITLGSIHLKCPFVAVVKDLKKNLLCVLALCLHM